MQFRDYQTKIIGKACEVIRRAGFVYLAMEVRTGKTLTSLGIAQEMGCKRVVFLTKKKAIGSIQADYKMLAPSFELIVTNYESMHKLEVATCDLLVVDEAHSLGAFPKPNKRAKDVARMIGRFSPYVILMSGTPTPESYSQLYHQLYGIPSNPFCMYSNFYRFADEHVRRVQRKINGLVINDYSNGKESIIDAVATYTIRFSQKDAGFLVDTREHILYVDMRPMTYRIARELSKNLVVEGAEETILADTPVKLMQKLHQIYSGTVKFESGNSMVIDTTKAEFIKDRFGANKIGVFYKFKAELQALRQVFGAENLTDNVELFNDTDCKVIALQIVSGREGISLRKADMLVYYNIDFSATSYWQSRDRMTTRERLESDVYWVFSRNGIEDSIYKAVTKKKDYTVRHFKKDLLTISV